jgi:hypothetical protein
VEAAAEAAADTKPEVDAEERGEVEFSLFDADTDADDGVHT